MRVLVTGGRDYADRERVFTELAALRPTFVVHGGCTGADNWATAWCEGAGVHYAIVPALWDYYGDPGGPIRNRSMLENLKPDLVLAFPGGKGTAGMVRLAERAGVEVRRVG